MRFNSIKTSLSFLLIFVLTNSKVLAQGIVRGKVFDENGETAVGVTITLKDNRTFGTTTDLDGNFNLKISDNLPHTLVISLVSYQTIEETIQLKNGEVLIKNYTLVPVSNELTAVEVTAKINKSKEYYMENIKINSAVSLNYISSETMKKTGDPNVVQAVARVSGVSTNGGFITVRGIGDRYVKTTLNGSRIPTLDPFTNNIKLDMFPSSLVDNIVISKTFSPDVPGDWAGAYLSVIPKDYPDKLTVDIESSVGYNNQSTLKNVLTTQKSSTDWLGYDNGYRDKDHDLFNDADLKPSQYRQMVALGLGDYYRNMGVNGWQEGSPQGEIYFKLGLIQLGLLAPADFDNNNAVNQAKQAYYQGDYEKKAFEIINSEVPKTGKSFKNNWNPIEKKAPLNFTQSFSIGNQFLLFGRPMGIITGFRYGNTTLFDPESKLNRAGVVSDGNGNLEDVVTTQMSQKITRETNAWSALLNISYKFNPNTNISYMYMPNFSGENNVRVGLDTLDPTNHIINKSTFYEQRRQLINQLQIEQYVPGVKLKMDFTGSYTKGNSKAPDFKNLTYSRDPITDDYQIGPTVGEGINRFYRYLNEDLMDMRFNAELPIGNQSNGVRKIRGGIAYQTLNRKNIQYLYRVFSGPYNQVNLKNDDLDSYFDLSNFEMREYTDPTGKLVSTIDFYYVKDKSPINNSFGNSNVKAAYLMSDYSITNRFRIVGGARIEKAHMYTDVFLYDSLGYKANDPRRYYTIGLPAVNPGKLDKTNILPSLNFVYKVRKDETQPINVRANYSQTVARPSLRELSDIALYDFEFRTFIYGNSDLKQVEIKNYDFRVESYFKNGDNISFSAFYKDFRNHIELVRAGGYTWQNVDKAFVQGIELEGKKRIIKNLDITSNLTLVKSETKVNTLLDISTGEKRYLPIPETTRPMFGQAPYVFNAILNYSSDSLGLNLALSYNVQGKRLVIISDVAEVPNIYEIPRHLLNFKVSKKFGKHININLTIRDILNAPIRRTYLYDNGKEVDFDRFRFGTNYILAVGYKF